MNIQQLADYVERTLGKKPKPLGNEFYYASLPLCILDAVFVVGHNHSGAKKVVMRFCVKAKWKRLAESRDQRGRGEYSVDDFINAYGERTPEKVADDLFNNRCRTSTKSGILKAEAVLLFAHALKEVGIQNFEDMTSHRINEAWYHVEKINGQGSKISFWIFLMLAGNDNSVSSSRMILRFIEDALDAKHTNEEAVELVRLTAKELNSRDKNRDWTPCSLDYAMWCYQSKKGKGSS